jgi:soluble cytochrome b562
MSSTPPDLPRKQSDDLVSLVGQLHAKAHEHGDKDAIAEAEKAHQHAQAGNVEKVRFYTESLKRFAALAPLANAILSAIADVGA